MSVDPWDVLRRRMVLIGNTVRDARMNAGHSLTQATTVTGVSPPDLCKIEGGYHVPTPEQAQALSEYVLQCHDSPETTMFRTGTPDVVHGARSGDPDTSHRSARIINTDTATDVHWALLELLTDWNEFTVSKDPTHEQVCDLYRTLSSIRVVGRWPQLAYDTPRKRMNDLKHAGWIRDSGRRADGSAEGHSGIVWELTDAGRTAWTQRQENER